MASDNKNDSSSSEDKTADTAKKVDSKATTDSAKPPSSSDSASNKDSAAPAKKAPPVLSDAVSPPPSNGKEESSNAQQASSKGSGKNSEKAAPKPPRKEKKSGGAIGWLALLIALIALAGVAYGLWMMQQAKDNKSAEQNRLSQAQAQQKQLVDSVKASTQALTAQVKGFASTADRQQTRVEELQMQLQATNRQIGEVTQVSRRSWMLAEAEYLLRLANQRLMMERETASALALLTSADEILVTVAEPGLFEVREALAREIAELRAIAHLDVEGVFVKLAALGEQVETLALLTPEADEPGQAKSFLDADEEQSVLDAALERFEGMVTVRRRDVPLEPLLTPEQHYYVQQNLRLMLEQAQLALLQRKGGIYSRSLDKAANWVQSYFQLNESAQALRATLRELQQANVNPELPNISASLALLKAYILTPLPGQKAPTEGATEVQPEPSTATGASQ